MSYLLISLGVNPLANYVEGALGSFFAASAKFSSNVNKSRIMSIYALNKF